MIKKRVWFGIFGWGGCSDCWIWSEWRTEKSRSGSLLIRGVTCLETILWPSVTVPCDRQTWPTSSSKHQLETLRRQRWYRWRCNYSFPGVLVVWFRSQPAFLLESPKCLGLGIGLKTWLFIEFWCDFLVTPIWMESFHSLAEQGCNQDIFFHQIRCSILPLRFIWINPRDDFLWIPSESDFSSYFATKIASPFEFSQIFSDLFRAMLNVDVFWCLRVPVARWKLPKTRQPWIFVARKSGWWFRVYTLPKTNIAPKNGGFQQESPFRGSIFSDYVSFREGNGWNLTPLCGDYFINHEIRIPINQDSMESIRGFFVGSSFGDHPVYSWDSFE